MNEFWLQHQAGIVIFLGVLVVIVLSNLGALRRLRADATLPAAPRVSVLIPTRNDGEAAIRSVRSLLAQDYPDFEVLVLDDGSTDGTAAQLAALVKEDPRLRVLEGRPLPEGWLGKHWACWQLADAATGDQFLFTDADTVHHPQALRAGVAAMQAERADLMSGFLRQQLHTWGERLTVPTIFWCFFSFLPIPLAHRIRAPGLSLTNEQWMLFRRAAYQAVGGHEAVRQSPIDDIMLGRRVKAKGLRWRVVDAGDYVSCRMYPGFRAVVEGFTKNLFAVFDFRLAEYLFVWLWLGLVTWEPLAVILLYVLSIPSQFALWPAVVAMAESLALWGIVLARLRFPVYLALLYPVNAAVLFYVALRSLFFTVTGRATWKGRRLPWQRVRIV